MMTVRSVVVDCAAELGLVFSSNALTRERTDLEEVVEVFTLSTIHSWLEKPV